MNQFLQDLLTFVGRRIITAHRVVRPNLDKVEDQNNLSPEELANIKEGIEREAIYLIGLADGLELARYIGGDGQKGI